MKVSILTLPFSLRDIKYQTLNDFKMFKVSNIIIILIFVSGVVYYLTSKYVGIFIYI